MSVVGTVVLGEHCRDRATGFGPPAHVECGAVEVSCRRTGFRCPHVESQGEHQ
jgi:hypothetical protein